MQDAGEALDTFGDADDVAFLQTDYAEIASWEMLDALHVLEGEADVGCAGLLAKQVAGTNLEYLGFPAFGEFLTHASGGDESTVGEVQSSDKGENGHFRRAIAVARGYRARDKHNGQDNGQLGHEIAANHTLRGCGETGRKQLVAANRGVHGARFYANLCRRLGRAGALQRWRLTAPPSSPKTRKRMGHSWTSISVPTLWIRIPPAPNPTVS